MNQVVERSVTQKLAPHNFADQIRRMSQEEAQECLIEIYQQVLHQEDVYKALLGKIADLSEALAQNQTSYSA